MGVSPGAQGEVFLILLVLIICFSVLSLLTAGIRYYRTHPDQVAKRVVEFQQRAAELLRKIREKLWHDFVPLLLNGPHGDSGWTK